jgi:ribonuclease R
MTVPNTQAIIAHLQKEARRPLKSKELAQALGVETADYEEFRAFLGQLVDEGMLYRAKSQRYALPQKINLVVGELQTIRSGAGFVAVEGGPDVYVRANGLGSAVDGDTVVARVERRRSGDRPEGTVIKVLERSRQSVVGVYHPAQSFGFVVPEDQKLTRDVFIPPGREGGARDGDVVRVRIVSWGDDHRGPAGEVDRVLGRLGDPGVDVLTVAYGHELPLEFPPDVVEEAERLRARGVTPPDLEGRLDLRGQLVFTIDPADAKDHDDALSLRQTEEGALGSRCPHRRCGPLRGRGRDVIDQEAFRRGTSVYMVDRVISMLPEGLSNDICSLRPHEDRLAVSLILRWTTTRRSVVTSWPAR